MIPSNPNTDFGISLDLNFQVHTNQKERVCVYIRICIEKKKKRI